MWHPPRVAADAPTSWREAASPAVECTRSWQGNQSACAIATATCRSAGSADEGYFPTTDVEQACSSPLSRIGAGHHVSRCDDRVSAIHQCLPARLSTPSASSSAVSSAATAGTAGAHEASVAEFDGTCFRPPHTSIHVKSSTSMTLDRVVTRRCTCRHVESITSS